MGRKSFISELPEDFFNSLNEKIRECKYGDHDRIVEWIQCHGYKTSRSAVHRYASELKIKDGFDGVAGSFRLYANLNAKESNLELLYKELGEIEVRKQEIIDRIRELMENK